MSWIQRVRNLDLHYGFILLLCIGNLVFCYELNLLCMGDLVLCYLFMLLCMGNLDLHFGFILLLCMRNLVLCHGFNLLCMGNLLYVMDSSCCYVWGMNCYVMDLTCYVCGIQLKTLHFITLQCYINTKILNRQARCSNTSTLCNVNSSKTCYSSYYPAIYTDLTRHEEFRMDFCIIVYQHGTDQSGKFLEQGQQ